MARRAFASATQAAALQASQRMIARGERPLYRVMVAQDGSWSVLGYPWLSVDATDRRSAMETTRTAVAGWLGVSPDAFDVVSG